MGRPERIELSDDDTEFFERVRVDFEAGIPLRQVAVRNSTPERSISHVTVANLAKRMGWTRNLSQEIHETAEKKLQRQQARIEMARDPANPKTTEQKLTDRRVIEANATRIAQVRGEHRADIERARTLTLKLFTKMEAEVALEKPSMNFVQMVSVNKALIDSLGKTIELERDAYGISDNTPEAPLSDAGQIDRRELARHVAFMLTREAVENARREAAAAIDKAATPT